MSLGSSSMRYARPIVCFMRGVVGCLATILVSCGGAAVPADDAPLRIGTTGDLPPFTAATETGGYEGVDVDLARDLGRTVGRPVVFVETAWQTLIEDAVAHRFDLALSAITVTEERARWVDFSRPYAEHTSVAVARCSDQARYASLEDLNRTGVTIGVRAGGTMAAYVHDHFPNAEIRETDDITSAFARLVAGEGDIIVDTDYEHRHHRGLCLALEGATFNPKPLAVLLPAGSPLIDAVNTWLEQRLADGMVGRL